MNDWYMNVRRRDRMVVLEVITCIQRKDRGLAFGQDLPCFAYAVLNRAARECTVKAGFNQHRDANNPLTEIAQHMLNVPAAYLMAYG